MSEGTYKIGTGDQQKGMPALDNAVEVGLNGPLFVMAGPCVIETEQNCFDIAEKLVGIRDRTGIGIIFKASFDKANRSSIGSFRGPGIEAGLQILKNVREKFGMPVMTDLHETAQAKIVAQAVDCIQVPAFLCRQTDLLMACARTRLPINVKKGQFMSPAEMTNVVEKIRACGNAKIMLTERGTFFGYNRLVNDMTSLEAMKQIGYPAIFDVTHSTQQPGGIGNASGGSRELAPILAKAAVASGANGLFIETHTDPANAKSDAACVMPIEWLEPLLVTCKKIFDIIREPQN